MVQVWSSFRPCVGVRAPFGRFCGRRVAAPKFRPTLDNQWKGDLCGLAPRLVELQTASQLRDKGQICEGLRGGRKGQEGDRRGCSAFVVPPYKNARCSKLEETIRGWARRRGLAVGCCCGAFPGDPDPIVRAILDEAGCVVMQPAPVDTENGDLTEGKCPARESEDGCSVLARQEQAPSSVPVFQTWQER